MTNAKTTRPERAARASVIRNVSMTYTPNDWSAGMRSPDRASGGTGTSRGFHSETRQRSEAKSMFRLESCLPMGHQRCRFEGAVISVRRPFWAVNGQDITWPCKPHGVADIEEQ